ncbi:hypothetical protein GL4_2848 [Methyloceanibacter caenitepidi]|uniref:Uncharacterized protein n=1 Tax=Methyloceanibacter caenitepidi TaxID=1384459 RepID=A0A0A8K659_9HYPH|nr:hypothetical protein GL4_2848 [Methyloceanibacter caenitepidi]
MTLIVCKTFIAGPPDQNAGWTGHENRDWKVEHGMMQCRRLEVQLFDQAEAMGAAAQPFNRQRCQRASIMLGVSWDQAHKGSSYRTWRVACPVPIVDTRTGEVIAWKMPECGHRDTVICETDTAI